MVVSLLIEADTVESAIAQAKRASMMTLGECGGVALSDNWGAIVWTFRQGEGRVLQISP
jgi:hypothetical protein